MSATRGSATRAGRALVLVALVACGRARPAPPAASPPPPITCEQLAPVAQHLVRADAVRRLPVASRAQLRTTLGDQVVHACLVDGWSPAAMACLHDARAAIDVAACDRMLRPIERAHLARTLLATVTLALRAARPLAVTETGIPECDAYVTELARYVSCPMVPDAAIEAARGAMENLRPMWRDAGRPGAGPAIRQIVAGECASARDALRQSMAALGCN